MRVYPGISGVDVETTDLGATLCELLACVDHNGLDVESVAIIFAALNVDHDRAAATYQSWKCADQLLHDACAGDPSQHSARSTMLQDDARACADELGAVLTSVARVYVHPDGGFIGVRGGWVATKYLSEDEPWSPPCREVQPS